jgi:hypothetical protein
MLILFIFLYGEFSYGVSGFLEKHHEDIPSQSDTQVSVECPVEIVTRFVIMIGHIALRQMLYLDVAVFCELKRRNMLREERNEALNTKNKKKKKHRGSSRNSLQNISHISMSASETPRNKQVIDVLCARIEWSDSKSSCILWLLHI